MPYSSAQISSLVGGQMSMFSSQAAFSQQVGGMAGVGPMPQGGGAVQNPYPDMGARIAGGAGQSLPGMAMGASIGGAMMGGTMGWLDPFTGVARGFAGGAGMGGAGIGQVAGGLGQAFAQGGLRAGAGMMAGGLAGAAAMALPYAAAGSAIQFAGENIYAGAQNISEVGGLTQHFGSQMGQPGARGGQMGRQTIKNIVSVLHDMVGDDVRTTMDDLKRLMDQAGQMGMLAGVSNAQEFKNRFTKIIRQVRDIADVMGTSVSEAAPMFAQMRQMGLWTASDVMGTSMALRVAGPAAGQMMGAMGAGAQVSHGMGGSMRAGAMMGRESFANLQAAQQAGVLTQENIMEFTGGVGGAQGQQMMAQRMTQIMSQFSQTSAGRLMMAGLGETEGGVFTGRMDKDKLNRFLRGEITTDQLQQEGQRSARTREGAMSFSRQEGKLGQQLGAQGGIEAITQIVQQVADTQFGGSEQARHQLFQKMMGVSNREAELLGQLSDEMPRIQDQRLRETEAHIQRTFDELERKQGVSWSRFKQSSSAMIEQARRPLQELGETMATDIGEFTDRVTSAITGRVERIPMGLEERARLLRGGALTADAGQFSTAQMGQSALTGTTWGNVMARMEAPGSLGRMMGMGGAGQIAGGMFAGPMGAITGAVAGTGAFLGGAGEGATPTQRRWQTIGLQAGATRTQMQETYSRAQMRAMTPTMTALGLKDEGSLLKMRQGLRTTIGKHSKSLRKIKKDDPRAYTRELLRLMRQDENIGPEIAGMSEQEQLDYLAVAQEKEGYSGSDLAVDFRGDVLKVARLATTPEELAEMQTELVRDITSAAGGMNITAEALSRGKFTGIWGAVSAIGQGAMFGGGVSEEQVTRALTGPGSDIFMELLQGEGPITQQQRRQAIERLTAVKGGDEVADLIESLGEEGLERVRGGVLKFAESRAAQIQPEQQRRIQSIAARGPAEVRGVEGFGEVVGLYKGGQIGKGMGAARELARGLTSEQAGRLRQRGGAIGGQVSALYRAQQLGPELGEDETQALLKEFQQRGYDIEGMGGAGMREMLKEGISAEEMKGEKGFKEQLQTMVQTQLSQTRGARGSAMDRLMEQIDRYTVKNTDFVNAVNAALGTKTAEAHSALTSQKNESSKATPGRFGAAMDYISEAIGG